MTETDPALPARAVDRAATRRWAAVRQSVRIEIARRRSPAEAGALLPFAPEESGVAAADQQLPDTFAALADHYPALLAPDQRKRNGAWFTPLALAAPTVARTLAPLLATRDPASLHIVDPAVGGGTFLRMALRELRTVGLTSQQAIRCLFGVDVDSTAAALGALALWEACDDPTLDPVAIATQVRAGDGLLDLPAASFDAVLTNPPWETLQAGPDSDARIAALRPRFRHQGRGKLFTYRLFVERAYDLLVDGGRLGAIVPASLWFDRDAEPLRRLLLDRCAWQWLFGMENRNKLFAIDGRYRFGIVVATKGGPTDKVCAMFGRTDPGEWAAPVPPHVQYGRGELRAASPRSGSFVEVADRRDLEVLARMHAQSQPLLGDGGAFTWRQGDFNMTADRDRFVLRTAAEGSGYRAHDDGVWRRPGHADLLPLWQGAMLYDLQPNTGAHAGGTGHDTRWEPPVDPRRLGPAYLVAAPPWRAKALQRCRARIVLRALSNATNARTAIACVLPDVPCGNSLGVLEPRLHTVTPLRELAVGTAVLGSLAFDWALRLRLGGTNLNGFVLADCVLPRLDVATGDELARIVLCLCAVIPPQDALWTMARSESFWLEPEPRPAFDAATRRQLTTRLDLLVGRAYGLAVDDIAWITRGCDQPATTSGRRRDATNSKGFFRIDRDLAPQERRPRRWLAAAAATS